MKTLKSFTNGFLFGILCPIIYIEVIFIIMRPSDFTSNMNIVTSLKLMFFLIIAIITFLVLGYFGFRKCNIEKSTPEVFGFVMATAGVLVVIGKSNILQ